MATAEAVFKTALRRIGFSTDAQNKIMVEGFVPIEELPNIEEGGIDTLMKHMAFWRDPGPSATAATPPAAGGIRASPRTSINESEARLDA